MGSYATYLIGRPPVGVNFELEHRNADFRYHMVRVRECESIAHWGAGRGAPSALCFRPDIVRTWWPLHEVHQETDLGHHHSMGRSRPSFPHYCRCTYCAGNTVGVLTQTTNAFGQVQEPL